MTHQDVWGMLDAYLDGELGAAARWTVTAHLDDCAICRKHAANLARLRGRLRGQIAAIEPRPELSDRIRRALATERLAPSLTVVPWPSPRLIRFGALLGPALVAVCLLIWITAPWTGSAADLSTEIAVSHTLFAQDDSLLDVSGDAETVSSWFRDQVGLSVFAPALNGYEVIGGRLIALDGEPVAQIVYESEPDETYLSLLRFSDRDRRLDAAWNAAGFATTQQGTTSVVTWSVAEHRIALVGTVPETELERLAAPLTGRGSIATDTP